MEGREREVRLGSRGNELLIGRTAADEIVVYEV